MDNPKIKPSSWFYVLAILVFVSGIAFSINQIIQGVGDADKSLQQVVVPGKSELSLEETGEYTIYHEYRSAVDGRIYESDSGVSGLKCTLTNESTGEKIELLQSKLDSSYTIGGRKGRSVMEFVIDKPGAYELSAWYEGNKDGPKAVLAISNGFMLNFFKMIFVFILEIIVVTALSLGIALITYFKREKYKKGLMGDF